MKGKDVGIIFDGTTREGEAIVVLVPFVQEWEVKSRLVLFQITQSSVNGDELVRIIIKVLHRKLDVPQSQLLAAMRDRAPVNTKTIGKVSILYPGMLDVGCISYFLNRVAVKSVTPVFDTIHVGMECDLHYQYESKSGRTALQESCRATKYQLVSIRWWSLWVCTKVKFEE